MAARSDILDRVADLLVNVPVRHPLRVAVDGITASGKTTFAHELTEAIGARGRPCETVSMDGFHHPRSVRYRRGRESADGYYEDAYDFGALRAALLDPLGPAGDGRYRRAARDLATDQPIEGEPTTADPSLVVIVDGSFLQRRELTGDWDVVVFLRASFESARTRGAQRDAAMLGSLDDAERLYLVRYHAAQRRYVAEVNPEATADIVIEHDDPTNPEIMRVAPELDRIEPRLRRTRAFFGPRAAAWDDRCPDDDRAYADAVAALGPDDSGIAIDLGCGSGRALPFLRRAVGPHGAVIGVDATPAMLQAARDRRRNEAGSLVLADVTRLPLRTACVDSIFAAGILTHVLDPNALLRALAVVASPACRLAVFHPAGRAALARRHGRELQPDEVLDPHVLPGVLEESGWTPQMIDDSDDRYLAIASRQRSEGHTRSDRA